MPSNINPAVPQAGGAFLALEIRQNFQAARDEIIALQDAMQPALLQTNNLSDLLNPTMARANLGLGTLATMDSAAVALTGGTIDSVIIGNAFPATGAFTAINMLGNFTSLPTGNFFANNGARVHRFSDRLLVGAATASDARIPSITQDWLSAMVVWPVLNATAAITSAVGTIALTVASQTLNLIPANAGGSTETTIGLAAFAFANNPGTFPTGFYAAYGLYSEAHGMVGSISNAFAAEFEAINRTGVANADPTPYRELQTASVQALRLGSGGGQGLFPLPAISAIGIVPNQSTFNAGIVFEKGALTGADGTTGFGTAIAMAKGHLVSWYASGGDGFGARTLFITSQIQDPTNAVSIQAHDGGVLFIQPDNQIGFSVTTVASSVNSIAVTPGATGVAPAVSASGTGTNLNLALRARAGGKFEFTCAVQASAFAGTGSAIPANAETFLQVAVNGTNYVLPLLKAA